MWHKNQYNGYILREFITEKTMYSILIKSNSDISETLKEDITEILVSLRKKNKLVITNEKLVLKKKKRKLTDTEINEKHQITNEKIYDMNDENRFFQNDNKLDVEYINNLIKQTRTKKLSDYINMNVIYAYVLSLRRNHNYTLIKIGFSDDFIRRHGELLQEFKCEMYLIGINVVHRQADERTLHTLLKNFFPQSVEDIRIESKNKVEVYKFPKALFKQYNGICEQLSTTNKDILIFNKVMNVIANNPTNSRILNKYTETMKCFTEIIQYGEEINTNKNQEPYYLDIKDYKPETKQKLELEHSKEEEKNPKLEHTKKKKSGSKTTKYKKESSIKNKSKPKSLVVNKKSIIKKTKSKSSVVIL